MTIHLYVHPAEADYGHTGSRYYHVTAKVCTLGDAYGEPTWPRWYGSWGDPTERAFGAFEGLEFTSQLDETSVNFYGLSVCYDLHNAGVDEMTAKAAALRKIDKRIEAIRERDGYSTDVAGYLRRLADAVGARQTTPFLIRKPGGGQWASGETYRAVNVDTLRMHVGKCVDEWRERHHITVAA